MKNKIKIVDSTKAPVAATLAIAFMEKSEECIRRVSHAKNRTYRSLVSALNDLTPFCVEGSVTTDVVGDRMF